LVIFHVQLFGFNGIQGRPAGRPYTENMLDD